MFSRVGIPEPELRASYSSLLTKIEQLEQEAHRAGLTGAAMKLNGAKNEIGWSFALDLKELKRPVSGADRGEEGGGRG